MYPWETLLITGLQLNIEPLVTTPLDITFQPIPYLLNIPPFKSISFQMKEIHPSRDKDVVGVHVKGLQKSR